MGDTLTQLGCIPSTTKLDNLTQHGQNELLEMQDFFQALDSNIKSYADDVFSEFYLTDPSSLFSSSSSSSLPTQLPQTSMHYLAVEPPPPPPSASNHSCTRQKERKFILVPPWIASAGIGSSRYLRNPNGPCLIERTELNPRKNKLSIQQRELQRKLQQLEQQQQQEEEEEEQDDCLMLESNPCLKLHRVMSDGNLKGIKELVYPTTSSDQQPDQALGLSRAKTLHSFERSDHTEEYLDILKRVNELDLKENLGMESPLKSPQVVQFSTINSPKRSDDLSLSLAISRTMSIDVPETRKHHKAIVQRYLQNIRKLLKFGG